MTDSGSDSRGADTPDDGNTSAGSRLCLECGICCRGVLYPDALLDRDEVDKASRYGLTQWRLSDGQDLFALPCRLHEHAGNTCTIYEDRFHVCRRYACDLLTLLRNGGISIEEAVAIVRTTRSIESRIYGIVGGYDRSRTIWQQITEHVGADAGDEAAAPSRHAPLLLQGRALSLLCHRHFERRMHKRLNANSHMAPRAVAPPDPNDGRS
jgi:uncharacterized protein